MPRIIPPPKETQSKQTDLSQERFLAESLLSQRIHFFIIFFIIIATGAILAYQFAKSYLILILSIGTIISWGLTFTIIRLSLRIKFIDKKLDSEVLTLTKSFLTIPLKILSWISDIFIPVVCSLLISSGLILSSSGFYDTKIIPSKVEQKLKEGLKFGVDTLKKESKPEIIKEYKSLDSVIQK
jgi:hypothetical protein